MDRVASTEAINAATLNLDLLSSGDLVALLARQQRTAFAAVEAALPAIAQAVDYADTRARIANLGLQQADVARDLLQLRRA